MLHSQLITINNIFYIEMYKMLRHYDYKSSS